MRTIRIKLYKFNELSKDAKQRAIENYRNENNEIFWADENRESMEKFAEIFPIKVTNWSYGGRGEGVSFRFENDEYNLEEMQGLRLAKYIWNNYKNDLYTYKYYGDANVKHCIKHKRIKTKDYKNGNFGNAYYSAITLEAYGCPLTGYCMDNELIHPIYEFLNKPDKNTNFKDLLEECFESWIKACNADIDDQNSDEYITNNIEANEYEFTKEGKLN